MLQNQRSKLDADRLVETLKRKGNRSELQLKGYHVASLYYQAKEYSTALAYCQNYVTVKPNDARAHKLLGQINEALQNVPKAIEGYRKALELNDMQKDLILKVAELYCKVRYEPERHRYWAERAEKYYPGHETVYKIREHIFRASGKLNELEQYLRGKLRTYPTDASLHTQLLTVLIDLGRYNDAKQLCVKVETTHLFDDHQGWWEQAINVYLTMLRSWSRDQSRQAQVNCMTTYCSLLYAINRLTVLSLSNPATSTAQTAEILKRLDHDLLKANDCVASSQYQSEVPHAQITLDEMKAQMYYHVGSLLMKMAANKQVHWHDVMGMAAVSYLVSLQVTPDESHANTKNENLANLYRMGCSRLSEICHVLHGLAKQHNTDWLEECVEQWCNEEGRQEFLHQVFGTRDDDGGTDLSTLHVDDSFLITNIPELPDLLGTVFNYDEVSVLYKPSTPDQLVWLGLQWDIRQDRILPDLGSFVEAIFERLVFSTNNLDNISVDNIRLLDIEAFLYASVHVASAMLAQLNERQLMSKDLPRHRPLVLHRDLCSEEQLEWYKALYQLYSGKAKSSDRAKLRLTAQKGLEVLRCRMNHGMETSLLVQLGKTFHARMKEVQNGSDDPQNKRDQWEAYQKMSVLYWQTALEQLRLLESGKAVPKQKRPFFPHQQTTLEASQIQEYLDEGSVVVSEQKFQLGKHQEALDTIDKARTPNALYTKAMMYKTLASIQSGGRSEDQMAPSEMSRQGDLLDKAKYALFATMDSIEDKPNHNLHEPVQEMLEEIETDQSQLVNQISIMEEPTHDDSRLSVGGNISNMHVRSKLEFDDDENVKDPSPRRLAAEMRAMNTSHTRLLEENESLRELQSSHNRILEQNQALMERQNELMESNNSLMQQIVEMNSKFQELNTKMTLQQQQLQEQQQHSLRQQLEQQKRQLEEQQKQQQEQLARQKEANTLSQDSSESATITPNKPIVIAAQMCKIETPNVSGMPPSAMVASPVHNLQGMYQHYTATPPAAYYHPGYPYGYDSAALHHSMMASATPPGRRSQMQAAYTGFEDLTGQGAAESEMALGGHHMNQVPPSLAAKHPAYASSPTLANLLVSQATQMQGQQQSPKPVFVKDQNGSRLAAVPDVASRAAGAMYDPSALSPGRIPSADRGLSPVSPTQSAAAAANVGMTPVAAPNLGMPPAAKVVAESPLLKQMLMGDDGAKVRAQAVGSSATGGTAVSPQQGSIASGIPVRPQASMSKPSPATANQPASFKQAQQGQAASPAAAAAGITQSPQAGFAFGYKPAQQQQQFMFGGKPTTAVFGGQQQQQQQVQASSAAGGFSFANQAVFGGKPSTAPTTTTPSAISSFTFRQPVPQASSTPAAAFGQTKPATSAAASPFAGFSFSGSPAQAATTTTSASVQKPAAPTVFGQKPVFGQQPVKPTVPASGVSFAKPAPFKPAEDEVILVSEKMPSADLQEKAKSLLLPPTFYNYLDAKPCPGCIGCRGENLDLDTILAGGSMSDETYKPTLAAASASVFGSVASQADSSSGSGFGAVKAQADSSDGSVFGAAASAIDFAALASNTEGGFAKKDSSGPFAFKNAGAQLFGGEDQAGGDAPADYDPHYEAIVSLPEVVDLKTGHEDEKELYKQRCRLYRFDAEKNMWKERGVGDVKLMRHSETGKVRVVMRRDQVHKVCANHTITPGMQLKPLETSDRAWVYNAIDFSEGDASPELLAIKFKNPDIALSFKEKFEECQVESAQVPTQPEPKVEEKPKSAAKEDLMAKFAAKPGEWNCEVCYVRNNADQTMCGACSTPKPGAAPAPAPARPVGFTFGTQQPQASAQKAKEDLMAKFAAKPGEWNCENCYVRNKPDQSLCGACNTPNPSAVTAPAPARPVGFTFGTQQPQASAQIKKPDENLMAKFAPKPGEWKCDGCFCQNDANMTVCPACGNHKPGAAAAAPATAGSSTAAVSSSGPQGFKPGGFPMGGFSFGSSSAAASQPASEGGGFKAAGVGFSFGSGGEQTTPVKGGQEGSQQTPATTPGGTPTTRFSFDAGDCRSTGLPQFTFGKGNKDPETTASAAAGFTFGGGSVPSTPERGSNAAAAPAEQVTPPQYPFTQALQAMSSKAATPETGKSTSSFAQMAQSTGSAFSFRMDVPSDITTSPPKPQKSPGLLRSPGLIRSPGGDGEFYPSEDRDDIHFEPIVQLPENVDLTTGEEDESVVFSHRCKLYRFDRESKQWKERGVGDIKLLHNPTSCKYRIVMRRDQVLRVCANHYLNGTMSLSPNAGSDRSWVWQAMDASDGEPQAEQLAVRFKTKETADKFKDIFELAIEELKRDDGNKSASASATTDSKDASKDVTPETSDPDGVDDAVTPETTSDLQSSEISSSSVEPKDTAAAANGAEKPKDTTKPMPTVESAFSEIFKNSPTPPVSTSITTALSGNPADHNPEEEHEIHFEPITKLPEKVDLQTGEESEEVMFCSRSKLYRFDPESKAWKDRGVGDVKILSNKETGRYRVIMRREQVLKVCANHYITPDMKLSPNAGSKNSWVWLAMDAAEGEPQFEQLAIKFKFEDTALRFKQVFEECQSKLEDTGEEETQQVAEEVVKKEDSSSTAAAAPPAEQSPNPTQSTAEDSQASAPATPPNTSTLGGGPVASPSDAASDEKGEAVGSTLGASPDVIPKSTASPSPELAPAATGTSILSLVKDTADPLRNIFGPPRGESGSSTTTSTSSSSTSNSNSHSASDEEGVVEEEEDDVGVSNV